jgi:gamma-glutamylcysteine synthetase
MSLAVVFMVFVRDKYMHQYEQQLTDYKSEANEWHTNTQQAHEHNTQLIIAAHDKEMKELQEQANAEIEHLAAQIDYMQEERGEQQWGAVQQERQPV